MFWSVVHLDPVEQIFLDPVTAHVGILLVDARDGLNDIEPFAIGPDELAFSGVELHVLHHITEGIGELSKLLALRRMPPCQEVVEEGIAGKDIVLPLLRMLVAPFAHEISIAFAVTRQDPCNLPAASQDAQARRSCAPAWLTDYESVIPSKESRTNTIMDRDHVGSRTAAVAVGLVVERN